MPETTRYILVSLILLAGMAGAVWKQKLTLPAAVCGGVLGFCVFIGAGFTGLSMMAVFFIAGTLATGWKRSFKEQAQLSGPGSQRRRSGQVFANAGVAALCGMACYFYPSFRDLSALMIAGAFAAATSDTLSSELGNIYGKRFFNILTFKKDLRGENGVVSIEGTIAGIFGAALIAIVFCLGFGFGWRTASVIVLAGTTGNLMDSVLGAALERKGILMNDAVNFLNTLTGALMGILIF